MEKTPHLPGFPEARPWTSAHRAGNSMDHARSAIDAGADLLETDIWLHHGRLELRHKQTLGPIPILWEKWSVAPGWTPRLYLADLLTTVPDSTLIFLDFKGENMELGPAVLAERDRISPDRVLATCGRNYPMLDTITDDPKIITFYSVGDMKEWPEAWSRVQRARFPAMSLLADLATPDIMHQLNGIGAMVVCWGVDDIEHAKRLEAMGVDGFTTDNEDLMRTIAKSRQAS